MTGMSIGYPPTDMLMGLGVFPAGSAGAGVTSTASPATSWLNITKHHGLYFALTEGGSTATGNGFTATVEVSEVASSSGANFNPVPFYYRTVATTAVTDQPGGSTIGTQWGAWLAATTAGVTVGVTTGGRYLQAWVSSEAIRSSSGLSAVFKGSTADSSTVLDNKYARLKITTAGTSSGGILAVAAHWVSPRYEQAIPVTYTT